jgi:phosphoenolpyruvate carboxylase
MAYTKDEWIREYKYLKRFMRDEGMSANIGMPFSLMLGLLESAKNYMETEKVKEIYPAGYNKLNAARDYLDWRRMHDEEG